ncbi:hypothetical protein [Roseovarius aestuariivivens]|uniref:hypothetical protein n=1 Tax=Roseovarius aestuariivivens TaxID=1888910 RepID=UPI001081526C|nr:hypothetical protein [Roseovarius aestuariivivens]
MQTADRHNRALTSIGHALTLKDQPEVWCGLETVLRARLSPYERACLLASVAAACETDPLLEVMETIVPARLAGAPLPVFMDIEEDACWWADLATLPEIRAWLSACFVRLPAREQLAFLEEAGRRAAA